MKQRFSELFSELFGVDSPEQRAELWSSSQHSLPVCRHRVNASGFLPLFLGFLYRCGFLLMQLYCLVIYGMT